MSIMKALTLLQPWADLVVSGAKEFETRSWMTAHRGPLAIHAGKGKTGPGYMTAAAAGVDMEMVEYGAVIGVVWLHGMNATAPFEGILSDKEIQVGDWGPGRYAWRLSCPMRLETPITTPGAQKLWTMTRDVADKVWAEMVEKGWPNA